MRHLFWIFVLMSTPVYPWGKTGHRVVGQLAYDHLAPASKQKVHALLGQESLAEASVWGDRIRSDKLLMEQYPMKHYLMEDDLLNFSISQCTDSSHWHALCSIEVLTKTLKDKSKGILERQRALKLLAHLVGDIHNPLHVCSKTNDCGQQQRLKWFGSEVPLHEVWDARIIELEELSYTEYATKLRSVTVTKELLSLPPQAWATESQAIRRQVEADSGQVKSAYDYSYVWLSTVETRLVLAGLRLARLLDEAL